jgi:hypothetical protein
MASPSLFAFDENDIQRSTGATTKSQLMMRDITRADGPRSVHGLTPLGVLKDRTVVIASWSNSPSA